MKTKLYVVLFLAMVSFATAQENVCANKEAQFSDYVKANHFDKANEMWLDVSRTCAKYSENIYILGSQILNYNIETSLADSKEKKVRDLLKLYENYDANFPDNKNSNLVKSAMTLYSNKIGTDEEVYTYLDNAYNKKQSTFTNPQAIYVYFNLYFKKYKAEKSTITLDQVIDKYNQVNALTFEAAKTNPKATEEYDRVKMASKALIYTSLKCENLVPYFEKNYDANKSDSSWLIASLNTLSEKCKSAKIFETLGLELHKINPSTDSNYFLGEYYLNTRDQAKAVTYFDQSVNLAPNGLDKAKKSYAIASILSNSDKEKSRKMILLASENDKTNGRYFIFLANLYSNSVKDCAATNPDEASAIYQLAANTVVKAGKIEPKLLKTSEKLAADYLSKITKKPKAKSVKINCWINETVQF